MTPNIERCAVYLPTRNVDELVEYYERVYGFTVAYRAASEFAICARGAATVMFRRVADPQTISPNEGQGGTWDLFCWVDDVLHLHAELAGRGADVVYGPVRQPYGTTEFAVRDPQGYVLGFGQDIPAAS